MTTYAKPQPKCEKHGIAMSWRYEMKQLEGGLKKIAVYYCRVCSLKTAMEKHKARQMKPYCH
jgi:hypothetical protein